MHVLSGIRIRGLSVQAIKAYPSDRESTETDTKLLPSRTEDLRMSLEKMWFVVLSCVYMMQVCSRESSAGDARADVSCKLWKVRSELRLTLFYLHEASAAHPQR
jgi:hypothetical protein